jgi:hypothetical protein
MIFKVLIAPFRGSIRITEDGVETDIQKPEVEISVEPDLEG